MIKESRIRSFAKALSNRITNSFTTFILAFIITQDFEAAWKVGTLEIFVKFFLFYFNERIWNIIEFGRLQTKPFVLWFTGLPGSKKSFLAASISKRLQEAGLSIQNLSGQDVQTLFPVSGFIREERNAYLKRMGYFSKILTKNNISVIACFISPYEESRIYNRKLITNYIEIYVSTPQEFCEKNDPWNEYDRARKGELKHFVGVSEPYETPLNPEFIIDLSKISIEEASKNVLTYLKNNQHLI